MTAGTWSQVWGQAMARAAGRDPVSHEAVEGILTGELQQGKAEGAPGQKPTDWISGSV